MRQPGLAFEWVQRAARGCTIQQKQRAEGECEYPKRCEATSARTQIASGIYHPACSWVACSRVSWVAPNGKCAPKFPRTARRSARRAPAWRPACCLQSNPGGCGALLCSGPGLGKRQLRLLMHFVEMIVKFAEDCDPRQSGSRSSYSAVFFSAAATAAAAFSIAPWVLA